MLLLLLLLQFKLVSKPIKNKKISIESSERERESEEKKREDEHQKQDEKNDRQVFILILIKLMGK